MIIYLSKILPYLHPEQDLALATLQKNVLTLYSEMNGIVFNSTRYVITIIMDVFRFRYYLLLLRSDIFLSCAILVLFIHFSLELVCEAMHKCLITVTSSGSLKVYENLHANP